VAYVPQILYIHVHPSMVIALPLRGLKLMIVEVDIKVFAGYAT